MKSMGAAKNTAHFQLAFSAGMFLFLVALLIVYLRVADISTPPPDMSQKRVLSSPSPEVSFAIGVVSRYAPSRIYQIYQPIVDYLSKELNGRIELRLSKDYEETVHQLKNGEVLIAFLGSYIYAKERLTDDLEPIVSPLNSEGKPLTRAALVVPKDSDIMSIKDLKNHTLALPSMASYSSNWLKTMDPSQNTLDFSELASVQYFDFHHTVIFQVLWGNFDAGVVRESIAKEYRNQGIRVVAYSPDFPSPPIVSLKTADPVLISKIKRALVKVDNQSISPLGFTGFAEARDESYEDLSQLLLNESGELDGKKN